jgi:hypothetical protein
MPSTGLKSPSGFSSDEPVLAELGECIRNGSAIAFAGAGASAPVYPTAIELIRHLIDYAKSQEALNSVDLNLLQNRAEEDSGYVLERLRNALGIEKFGQFLLKELGPRGDYGFTPNHDALMRANFKGYLTTNFDLGLEFVRNLLYPSLGFRRMSTWEDSESVESWITGKAFSQGRVPILYLHGKYDRPETLMFQSADYAKHGADGRMRTLWLRLFMEETIMFVGSSLRDDWLLGIAQEAKIKAGNRPNSHFALRIDSLSEAQATDQRKYWHDKYGILPIFAQKPEDITYLLQELAELFPRDGASVTGSQSEDGPPLSGEDPSPEQKTTDGDYVHAYVLADQPTSKDTLGFDWYAQALANFIRDERTGVPLTISVEAEWGSGKSSFLLQVEEQLRTGTGDIKNGFGDLLTVWFNPWRHDAGEALWAAFAVAFENQLNARMPLTEWLSRRYRLALRRLRRRKNQLRFIRGMLPMLGWIVGLPLGALLIFLLRNNGASENKDALSQITAATPVSAIALIAGLLFASGKKLKEFLGNPFRADITTAFSSENYADKVAAIERFHEHFCDLVTVYGRQRPDAGRQRRIVVFIDDLDRCEVPKAAELLQSLQLLMSPQDPAINVPVGSADCSCPSCDHEDSETGFLQLVFVLGIDRRTVAAGIAAKNETLWPYLLASPSSTDAEKNGLMLKALEFGFTHLEKFIDVTLRLPRADSKSMTRYLDTLCPVLPPAGTSKETPENPSTAPLQSGPTPPMPDPAKVGGPPPTGGPAPPPITTTLGGLPKEKREAKMVEVETELRETGLVHSCAEMAAPLLENNPRRVKQFVNTFRLRARLTVLGGAVIQKGMEGAAPPGGLHLPQIAKLVAIELAYPMLLDDWFRVPQLFGLLYAQPSEANDIPKDISPKWSEIGALKELILYSPPDESVDRWSLLHVDPICYLAIAPPPAAGEQGIRTPK